MKKIAALFSLLLLTLFASPVAAQTPVLTTTETRINEAQALLVVKNLARTAYFVVHGSYQGFNPNAVVLYGSPTQRKGDVSPWVRNSVTFARRLQVLARMESKGRIYHLWPSLLQDRAQCFALLKAHYTGTIR